MEMLLLFAFLSGLITIFAPCIWPLLPIILSANVNGGHKKPLGITLGIMISFATLTLATSYIIRIIPFDPMVLKYVSVIVLCILGFTFIFPLISQKIESVVSRISGKLGSTLFTNRTGFKSGFIVGLALGVVWTPCAGPILATIATLAATQSLNINIIIVTVVYIIGVGIPLFIFTAVGNTFFRKSRFISKYTGRIQQVFGVFIIVIAFMIATNYDKTLQAKLLDAFPAYGTFLVNLESNSIVTEQLKTIKQSAK